MYRRKLTCALGGIVVATTVAFAGAEPTVPSFNGLGDLPGGVFSSEAFGVSADGMVVAGWSRVDDVTGFGDRKAFRWTWATGIEGLEPPSGSVIGEALAASADGAIVIGGVQTGFVFEPFIWDSSNPGGFAPLGRLTGASNQFGSRGESVSDDGSVVVGSSPSGFTVSGSAEAFRWTIQEGMVALGDLPGGIFDSRARDVSSDGEVIVGRGNSNAGYEAFRWTPLGGMVGLGDLSGGGFFSDARSVSADGSTVVGWGTSTLGSEAFRWSAANGLMIGLGDLLGGIHASKAFAVSADGAIVVGWATSFAGVEAFLWDDVNGMRSLRDVLVNDYGLDLSGWTLREARGVSADGRTIVGSGINTNGMPEAWIACLPQIGGGARVRAPEQPDQRLNQPEQRLLRGNADLLAFDTQSPGDTTFRTMWQMDQSDGSATSVLQWQTQLQVSAGAAWMPDSSEMMHLDIISLLELWPMNIVTGEHHRLGLLHPRPPVVGFVPQCLAADPTENFLLYFIAQFGGGMYRIAPDAESTWIANVGASNEIIAGLTFDAFGQMWGAEFFSGWIIRIDKITGNITPVGLGVTGIQGLDFDEHGALWAYSTNTESLYTIDLTSGNATLVGSSPQTVFVKSLAFASVPGDDHVKGDWDGDGDVDLDDYIFFAACMFGPNSLPEPPLPATVQECLHVFDFDEDVDVDLLDSVAFETALSP